MACRSSQIPGRPHRVAARRASLGHPDLAACPSAGLLNGVPRTLLFGLHFLKEVQHMLRTVGCPECKQLVMAIAQGAATTNSDQSGIAQCRENHTTSVS